MAYPYPPDPSEQPLQAPPQPPATVPYRVAGPQQPQQPQQWTQVTPAVTYQITDRAEKRVSPLPLLSMITGIATVPFLCSFPVTDNWPILSAIIAVVAVALGHVGLALSPRSGTSRSNGMAVTGLIFGYLMIAISIVWILLKMKYGQQTGG